MRRFLLFLVALVAIPAVALAYPPATVSVTDSSVTLGGLDCGTQYRVQVEERNADDTGWTSLDTYTPTTSACPANPPTADFSIDPNPAVRNQATTFASTGTCQATPCTYRWFHGDTASTDEIEAGATQPNTSAQFTYVGPAGPREITLKVTDAQGRTASKTVDFQLVDATSPPPPPPSTGGFPDASNTGVPAGTVLKKVAGFTVNTDNTVVDGVDAPYVWVNARNVTIKNSYIHNGGIPVNVQSGNVTVQDSTLACGQGVAAIAFNNYTAIRVNASQCENGFRAGDNVTIRDSYVHDLTTGSTQHNDGIDADGPSSNVVIDHNAIHARDTSAIIMYTKTDAANSNWSITNNYLDNPDNVDLYCNRITPSNVVVTGNVFKKPVAGSKAYTDSCVAGHVTTWSGNVDADTGATIPLG